MAYIKKITTENTGGGCFVDFVHLGTGEVIAISDEAIVVYKSYDNWLRDIDGEHVKSAVVWLNSL